MQNEPINNCNKAMVQYSYFKINKNCLKELEIQKNFVRSGNFTDTFSKVSNKTK